MFRKKMQMERTIKEPSACTNDLLLRIVFMDAAKGACHCCQKKSSEQKENH